MKPRTPERHKAGEHENPFLKQIRDHDIDNPAPFGKNRLLLLDDDRTVAECPETKYFREPTTWVLEDVPIERIAGICDPGHLDNYSYGMSLREILFNCLHGVSLTQGSLDYFIGDAIKGDYHKSQPGYSDMPQDMACIGNARSRGGINLVKRGDVYFATRGQQRTLMAMFWIYQKGRGGVLTNVSVEESRL